MRHNTLESMLTSDPQWVSAGSNHLQAVFDNALDAILMADEELCLVESNPAGCALTGYTRDELLQLRVQDLTPASNQDLLARLWQELMSAGALDAEYELLRKDGTIIVAEFRAVANVVPGVHFAILHDITARKRAEEMRAQLAAIVESSEDAIFSKSLDGIIQSWNRGAQQLYGYSPEQAIGQNVSLILPPQGIREEHEIIERIKRGEVIEHYETKRSRQDGSAVDVAVTISPIKDAGGRIVGASSIGRDIGERRKAEAEQQHLYRQVRARERQLRSLASYLQTAREDERTKLARQIHDELGQALTAIRMDLAWLKKRIPGEQAALEEKVKRMTALVDETVIRVREMATELRPGLLDHVGLVAAMEWQAKEFSERTEIVCELHLGEQELVTEDEMATQLFRIFQEALTNIARHARASRVWIRLAEERGMIVLSIKDNGRGIPRTRITSSKSIGLLGMRERTWALGGEFEIRGVRGTHLQIRIPRPANS